MILLSAGHYPAAPGARTGTHIEHVEAMRWVKRIAQLASVPSVIVPTGNLPYKVEWINHFNSQIPVHLALELHFNSDPQHAGKGCETLFCPKSEGGIAAAQVIHGAIAPLFPPSRGIKEGWYQMDRPGHVDYVGDVDGDEKVDYFLKATNPIALIVEPEFIHNGQAIDERYEVACRAIADALGRLL